MSIALVQQNFQDPFLDLEAIGHSESKMAWEGEMAGSSHAEARRPSVTQGR